MSNNNLYINLEKKYGKQTLTVEESATELGVGVDDINEAIENGDISVKKLGKKVLIPISSLVTFLSEENSSNETAKSIDYMANSTVTSQETTEIVEDDTDMAKGSITFVKSAGLWLYQLDLGKTADGKRIRKSKSFKTEIEARQALDEELAKLNSQPNSSNKSKSTIDSCTIYHDYLNYYLSLELGRGTSRTRDGYFYSAEKIIPELGQFKLKELTSEVITRFLNKLKKDYSQSTLDKVFLVLNMSLRYAVETEIISKNPMRNVTKPKTAKVKTDEYKAYTESEISDLLTAARCYPDIYPIILVLLHTGMRPGELRALKLKDIDFNDKTIHVKAAATFDINNVKIGDRSKIKEIISTTKSNYSVRKLVVPDIVITALQQWREYVNTNKQYKKARNSKFLFPALDGDFIGDSVLRNRFKKFLKNEGFDNKGFTLYRFRHTMCTTLIKNGTAIPTVQRIMGDNTTDVILKIYTSINANDIREASYKAHQYFASI